MNPSLLRSEEVRRASIEPGAGFLPRRATLLVIDQNQCHLHTSLCSKPSNIEVIEAILGHDHVPIDSPYQVKKGILDKPLSVLGWILATIELYQPSSNPGKDSRGTENCYLLHNVAITVIST